MTEKLSRRGFLRGAAVLVAAAGVVSVLGTTPAFSALSAAIVFEVQTGGSDTNGGGFKTGATGTDWTQQAAAQYSVTDGVTAGTTTVTSATANFGTDVVGNVMYVQGGTGSVTAAWYEITVRNSATSVTVDRSTGLTAGTGVTLHIGGALASLGAATAIATVSGQIVYQKNGTYTITSTSTNVAAGCVSPTTGTLIIGYSSSRTTTNSGTHPLNQFNTGLSTATFYQGAGIFYARNIDVDGHLETTSKGGSASACIYDHCKFLNFTGNALTNAFGGYAYFCEYTGCTTSAVVAGGTQFGCEAYANTAAAFTQATCINCIAYGNTGATTDGFQPANVCSLINCVSYNNGRDGFRMSGGSQKTLINCIAEGNAAFGYNVSNGISVLENCSSFNNTSGRITGTPAIDTGVTTHASSAFTNAAGNDFSLNNTAGAGATLRAAGYPGVFPRGTTTGYIDIGAAQHADPAVASSRCIGC